MLGTVLIVLLILALIGASPDGATAANGVTGPLAAWGSFSWL